jgi:hypothetical protein
LVATTTRGTCAVWLWDARTGERLLEVGRTTSGFAWSAQFSPDSRYLATALSVRGIEIWSIAPPTDPSRVPVPEASLVNSLVGDIWSASFAPGNQIVFLKNESCPSGRTLGNLFAWEFTGASPPRLLATGLYCGPQTQTMSRNGHSVFAFDGQNSVLTVDLAQTRATSKFETFEPASERAVACGTELQQTKLPNLQAPEFGGNWHDTLIANTLLQEAKALIQERR